MNITFSVSNKIFADAIGKLASCTGARKVGTKIVENCVVITLAKPCGKPFASAMVFDGKKQLIIPFFLEEANNEQKEVIYININKLLSLARAYDAFDETMIRFEISNKLKCQCLDSKLELELGEEALVCEKIEENLLYEFVIKPNEFSELIKQGGYTYAEPYSSVTIELGDKLSAMSYISTRIVANSTKSFQYTKRLDKNKCIAIDGSSLFSIIKLFDDQKDIVVSVFEKYVKLTNSLIGVIIVLNENKQIIPVKLKDLILSNIEKETTIIEVESFDLKMGIEVLEIIDGDVIYCQIEEDKLILNAKEKKGQYIIDAKIGGNKIQERICFSSKLLKESLNHTKETTIKMIRKKGTPLLGIVGKNDKDFKTIITLCKSNE